MKLLRNYREAVVGPSCNKAKELLLCRILVWSGAEATAARTSLAPQKAMLSHGLEYEGNKMMNDSFSSVSGRKISNCVRFSCYGNSL